jgi:hypothetical protein
MNHNKLKDAEQNFLDMYPGGFNNPVMIEVSKKHKPEKMTEMAKSLLAEENFRDIDKMAESLIKIISASSMVSVFEKPKFRDFVRQISFEYKEILVSSHYELIHGNQREGFNNLVNLLEKYRMAKWTYTTACNFYYYPDIELFVKPTTCKGVIDYFELPDLKYRPLPDYEFYVKYRDAVNEMKNHVDKSIAVNNGAFSGFLMMSLP